jgi:uncharacterized surface protein with fasciclin (FAS1) repeats
MEFSMRTSIAPRFAAAGVAVVLLLAGCSDDSDGNVASTGTTTAPAETTTTMASATGDIVETASAAGDFTVLLQAAQAAGLVDALKGPGPLTVFAPTDQAFADALDALGTTKEQLLSDTAKLKSILTYHVVSGEVPASEVVTLDGQSVETLNGAEVDVSVDNGTVYLNGDTKVVATDVMATNGVIHVIDGVLLPPA